MNDYDPKGYYALLRVLPAASAEEIKAAYRRAAMDLHPDRSKSPDATQLFQRLAEAYRVLSEPDERAIYDREPVQASPRYEPEETEPPEAQRDEPAESGDGPHLEDLIVCSACEYTEMRPRYSVFYKVKSFLLWTKRERVEGIFCEECAEKEVLKATAITWLFGLWSLRGFFYSLHAIVVNLAGGERPADINAQLVTEQALAFWQRGDTEIAILIALDAKAIARTLSKSDRDERLKEIVEELLAAMGHTDRVINLTDSRPRFGRPFYIQAFVLIFLVAIGFSIVRSVVP
jgi:hypothetical protein